MSPHLQVMCGPLLRYDTVEADGTYRGACMLVTADAGSVYSPHPSLKLEWAPGQSKLPSSFMNGDGRVSSEEPHVNGHAGFGPQSLDITGTELWVHHAENDNQTFTFWRFMYQIPLADREMNVRYRINQGPQYDFWVPGRQQNMRWAAHSCNGFSAGVDPDDFRRGKFASGFDPVWSDLLERHSRVPYHVLIGGGDQLYCDALIKEPEMQEWVRLKTARDRIGCSLSDEIKTAIDRFFFNHYCNAFQKGAFAKANGAIPMVNMLDDHDLIDGFGSYPDDIQSAPVFSRIGERGYFYYLLFQCFIVDSVDGTDLGYSHVNPSIIFGGLGPYIKAPSHSFLTYLGPRVYMLLLDCRAERRKNQVCSEVEYRMVFDRLDKLPPEVDHLVVLLGIPIAYPRMNFLENALESKFNPLVALGKAHSFGLTKFVNRFNAEAELLDDLNDHWTASAHKKERNWLVQQLQEYARRTRTRVTFLSGDVHCAAVGVFRTLVKGKVDTIEPKSDYRYMLNVISSAIVNTPPPDGVLHMVSFLSTKTHKTMHYCDTDETMLPVFAKGSEGSSSKYKSVMGSRNYCSVWRDEKTGDLVFDIRVEIERGFGRTASYAVRAPPPAW
ncbi:hypothetical protein SISSUDRAFT_1111790 [Sistotremastrum suecicum HHB10207 ss-3]|uniref:PhoD-like phosphatase domain-containing protein n=1 Tax=Sistotremastrum suecicum HHB10207 ss-3 TaxID=1314776 RepID=A0A166IVT6_9AGAM|nr:hypothetical protein SISSUDRAFT_1111790 [Sistotremastrum suecicum HHB10207 ss-3]